MSINSSKKIIAVLGATGAQGGGLVRAIAKLGKDGEFTARAISRDPSSPKAQALKKLGVDVVQANINDKTSLLKAVQGCYGMFCVTFFWQHMNPEKETAEARSMAEVAGKAGIEHVVWSTLEDTRKLIPMESTRIPTLMGKYKVLHFDSKGEADKYFADLPTTYLLTSFYWENFTDHGLGPRQGPGGKYYLSIPMGKRRLPCIATEDIGKCALGVFKRPREYINKRVGIAGEHLTMAETAAKMSRALSKQVLYYEVSFDTFRKLPFLGADDIGNMLQYNHDYEKEFCGNRSVEESRKLNPELLSFDHWLAINKHRIPLNK